MKPWLPALVLVCSSAAAGEFVVYGAGALSCAQWTELRQTERGWVSQSQWLQGYLVARGDMGATLRRADQETINLWVDGYCAAQPLNELLDAARGLVSHLEAEGGE